MKLLMLILLFFTWIQTNGQTDSIDIEGKIYSKNKQPIAGVQIILKGTVIGTVSGLCGDFNLTIPNSYKESGILIFRLFYEGIQEFKLADLNSRKANFRLMGEHYSDNNDCSKKNKYKTYKVKVANIH